MIAAVERYLALRAQLGYQDTDLRRSLRQFAAFAAKRGATRLRNDDVLAWVDPIESGYARKRRLDWIANMGTFLRAEDGRHEILPSRYASRMGPPGRPMPFVYSDEEIVRVMDGFGSLGLSHPYDAPTYRAIVGLIAATGMRLGEALNLSLADVNGHELFIRQTKFNKDRLVFVDDSTRRALDRYLALRPPELDAPKLFVIWTNRTPSSVTVDQVFRRCRNYLGLEGRGGSGPPRIHDLRHTFAIRSLAECAHDEKHVAHHIVALSTHLGHVSVKDTYWYLRLLPETKLAITQAMEDMRHA
ncbi:MULTISPECIES: tyrosine-type recombinase/integrase [Sphingomonas]|uniref:tyrosine-type recombinase/integrase n=1 Tax=Sphingomonas TaxID=13687 RepID=UPI00254E6C01|nr:MULTISPECIES: tyrosine-type recombinase/integrase [Sphingomonas]MDK8187292.1 tyrosine-type recombinase/integrase [Sphingomonas zeae]MDK8217034.1 tyrosine-type recombinase/integrase [Sphingomonas sp. UMB7805-LC452B]